MNKSYGILVMNMKLLTVLALAGMLTACGGEKRKSKRVEEKVTTTGYVCKAITDDEISKLFDRWNEALKTGDAKKVADLYGKDSILLPTVSDKVRHSPDEKEDYFKHFLAKKPIGEIRERDIQIGCNWALDAGVYAFKYQKTGEEVVGRYSFTYRWNGKDWEISSHHSSLMPEKLLKLANSSEQKTITQAQPEASNSAVSSESSQMTVIVAPHPESH